MSGQISIGRPKAGDETEAMRRPDSFHVEGGLWKLGKRWNVNAKAGLWHKKFAILHDKTFHVYESQRSFHDGEPSRRVPLQGATIQRLDEADGVRATPSCFIIGVSDPFEARCHIFAVSTEESRTHWIECMEDAAKAQKGRHASMPDISAEDRAGAMSKLEATGSVPSPHEGCKQAERPVVGAGLGGHAPILGPSSPPQRKGQRGREVVSRPRLLLTGIRWQISLSWPGVRHAGSRCGPLSGHRGECCRLHCCAVCLSAPSQGSARAMMMRI